MRWCCFSPSVADPTKVLPKDNDLPKDKEVTAKDEVVVESVNTSIDRLVTVEPIAVKPYSPVSVCNMILLGIIIVIVYTYVLNPDTPTYIRRDREEL
jgi:hypothetical protein